MQPIANGFLLTRASIPAAQGVINEFWVKGEQQLYRLLTAPEPVVFFVEAQQQAKVSELLGAFRYQAKPLSLTTFEHQGVVGLYFSSGYQANQAAKLLQGAGLGVYESDIKAPDRYLMERFIQGGLQFTGHFQSRPGYIEVSQAQIKAAPFQPEFKTVSLDIECSEKGVLYSIGLYADWGQWVLMVGEQTATATHGAEDVPEYLHWYEHETALIQGFISWLNHYDPDIIIGWAVVSFDMRLLIKRALACGLSPDFGRAGLTARWRDGQQGGGFMDLSGRVVIDGIDALKVATYHFDSFSLEFVAQALLGQGKAADDVDNRMAEINHNFAHNKVALAKYNLQDCKLVWDIFEHTHLLAFLQQRTQLTGLELERSGGSVAAFTNLYLPKVHRAGYVAPNLPPDGGLASPGGYVMESAPGLYQDVLVLDYKSLYPSIIRTFKIDPVGLIEGLKQPKQAIPGFLDAMFSRETHFLPDIIHQLWQARDQAKKQQDSAASQAIKIIMNSFYGVLGSGGCRFYDTRLASSITLRGHEIMKQSKAWIEAEGYQVIYGDTDSTFVWLNQAVSPEQANQIGQDLATLINRNWQQKLADEHDLTCHLEMEFETHYHTFFMPTIRGTDKGSKKRYAGLTGYGDNEKLVFKGLETVRSDWTPLAKQFQVALYQRIFANEDPSEFIRDWVEATRRGERDQDLVYKKRLRQSLNSYTKNVPPHARAAMLADEQNRALGKPLRYQRKGAIAYLMTLAGPQPIEYVTSLIDYDHYIDKQIKPIADAILPAIDLDFDAIVDDQLGLF